MGGIAIGNGKSGILKTLEVNVVVVVVKEEEILELLALRSISLWERILY